MTYKYSQPEPRCLSPEVFSDKNTVLDITQSISDRHGSGKPDRSIFLAEVWNRYVGHYLPARK